MPDTRFEVTRNIAASPSEIFDVVASPDGHVAIDGSGMLMWAEGDRPRAVGDRFTMHMDRDSLRDFPLGEYEVDVVITTFELDREVAWTVDGMLKPPIGHIYGFKLEPTDGGTTVTHYYDWSEIHEDWKAAGVLPVLEEKNLLATLGILARTVAPGKPRPGA
jgi:hypothetical protein